MSEVTVPVKTARESVRFGIACSIIALAESSEDTLRRTLC
jgi:hypothetical protein